MAKLYFHTNNLESYKNAEFAGYLNKLQVDSVFRRRNKNEKVQIKFK